MTFSAFQESAQKAALGLIKESPATLTNLHMQFREHFPESLLSAACVTWGTDEATLLNNTKVTQAVQATLDSTESILCQLRTLEDYITLTIPKMEDGNNFGVTVQLAALKHINDNQESLMKQLEDVLKYTSSRADALEKCKLPSETKTTTSTSSESSAAGTDKEKGEIATTNKATAKEEKTVSTNAAPKEAQLRRDAVLAVDMTYYVKSKTLFRAAVSALLAAVDFMEKNSEKIKEPKGSRGSQGHFTSMY